MSISDIIATIATVISLFALAVSVFVYCSTLAKIGIEIYHYNEDDYYVMFNLINKSAKSICIVGLSIYQSKNISVGKFDRPSSSGHFVTREKISSLYLSPYEAYTANIFFDFDKFDRTKPITLCVNTSRHSQFFKLDLSDRNNPKVHKQCYYRKRRTYNR